MLIWPRSEAKYIVFSLAEQFYSAAGENFEENVRKIEKIAIFTTIFGEKIYDFKMAPLLWGGGSPQLPPAPPHGKIAPPRGGERSAAPPTVGGS